MNQQSLYDRKNAWENEYQVCQTLGAGMAAHMNNYLYVITGYIEMAMDDVSENSHAHDHLRQALRAVWRGKELITEILTVCRLKTLDFAPVDLGYLLSGVASLMQSMAPPRVALAWLVEENPGNVSGDFEQLHRAMVNLVNNAFHAMEGTEGKVTITLSRKKGSDPEAPAMAVVSVKDEGCGMGSEVLQRAFEPFFTTKPMSEGSGLGLSVARAIVQGHDGAISAHSEPCKGSEVIVELPTMTLQ